MPSDIIRQTIQFQDPRRSLLLNAHNKDNYGRHRGIVLYGMQVTVTGANTLAIGAGAIYSPFGTKVFVDLAAGAGNTITVPTVLLTSGLAARPYMIAVIAQFKKTGTGAFDPAAPASIASRSDLQGTNATLSFTVRNVAFRRDTAGPTQKLAALDPIGMVAAQDDAYSFTTEAAAKQVGTASLAANEVLLAYIIMGVNPTTGVQPTALNVPGVSVVQCKNLVEGLTELVGFDPLMGRNDTATEQYPAGAALNQTLTAGPNSGTVPMPAPHYGAPDDGSTWSNYKHPNFLRDGDTLVDALRRLDYVLRLWMDRTGDQDLIGRVQDGTVSGLPARPTLDQILDYFTGGTLTGANNNSISWEQPSDTSNLMLKNGNVVHAVPAVTSTSVDTHKTAIAALNRAIWHMLKDILGVSISATEGRQDVAIDKTLNSSLQFTNERAQSTAIGITGSARTDYLYTDALFSAVATIADRSRLGSSSNLLRNPNLARGTLAAPESWVLAGATRSSAVGLNAAFAGVVSSFSVTAGGSIAQSVTFDASQSTTIIGDLLSGTARLGAALAYQSTATAFVLEVETTDGTAVTSKWTAALAGNAKFAHASFIGRVDLAVAASRVLTFRILNTGGTTATLNVLGAALGLGVQAAPITDPLTQEFMPRDGRVAATADIDFGSFKGVNAADGVNPGDVVNRGQLDAVQATLVAADAVLTADVATNTANISTNTSNIAGNTASINTLAGSSGLNEKANLASPALTGTPTAPTPTAGDNTTKLATTAFVKNAIDLVPYVGRADLSTTPGSFSWTVPANILSVLVVLQGGAGGGGSAAAGNAAAGGAGGLGGVCAYYQTVTPGGTLTFTIGGGGSGGTTIDDGGGGNDAGGSGGGGGGATTASGGSAVAGGGGGGGGGTNRIAGAGGAGGQPGFVGQDNNGSGGAAGSGGSSYGGTGGGPGSPGSAGTTYLDPNTRIPALGLPYRTTASSAAGVGGTGGAGPGGAGASGSVTIFY